MINARLVMKDVSVTLLDEGFVRWTPGELAGYIDDGVILCCREIQKSISDSIYGSLVSFIYDKNLIDDFKILNNEITNLRTGAKFIFAGLKHNITNIKSIHKLRVVFF